jgi:flagellar biosynthesis protein FliR
MNGATLSTLVNSIGPDKVKGFFLVLARISPLFVVAPLFSSKMVPTQVRTVVAVALAMGLTPIAVHGQRIPTDPLGVAGLLVEQVLVGLAFSYAVGAVFYAIQAAGALTDMIAGFSFGSLIDPINGNPGGTLTNLYSLVGLAFFIAIGGDAWMLRGLARTFTLVPLTKSAPITSLTNTVEQAFGSIFVSAIEIAAPTLLAMLITDIALGMVSKVVPQLNVFAVGFAIKIAVAMLVVAASLPFISDFMNGSIATAVTNAINTI